MAALRQVGIEKLKELFPLPPAALLQRFGPALLKRIYQALGYSPEAVTTVRPAQIFSVRKAFENPLANSAAVKICLFELFKRLLLKLSDQKRSASSFEILIESLAPDGSKFKLAREVSLCCSAASLAHLESILTPFAESLALPGPVLSAQITARHSTPETYSQQDFSGKQESADLSRAASELFDELLIRLGNSGIKRLRYHNAHLPEQSFAYEQAAAQAVPSDAPKLQDRPPRLLARPLPIRAMALLPDHPPAGLYYQGKAVRILTGSGPERISVPWWTHGAAGENDSRDYFKVQDQSGRWFWIFRENQNQAWFLHGIWS